MTEIAVEAQTKNGEKLDKEYSIEWFENTCIIRYKGEIYNRVLFEGLPFISYLGWVAVLFAGILSIVLGFCTFFIILFKMTYLQEINDLFGFLVTIILSLIPTALFLGGRSYFRDILYVKSITCKRCHKKCAYEETEAPDIKEVSTEDSYEVTITRYWKCKHCRFICISEGQEKMKCYKEWEGRKAEIKCEKCRKKRILPECRKPDVKVYDSAATKTSYYRCEYCGHINVSIKRGSVSMEDGTITYGNAEGNPRL